MSTKLYVGNLSFNTTAQDLETLFGEHGTVQSASLIEDRETGRTQEAEHDAPEAPALEHGHRPSPATAWTRAIGA